MALRSYVTALAAVLLVAAALTACDGGAGDEAALEDYFQEVDRTFEDTSDGLDTVAEEFLFNISAATTSEEAVQALIDFLARSHVLMSDAADDIEALDAPEAARASHNALLAALRRGLDRTEALQGDLQGAQEPEDLGRIANQSVEELNALGSEVDAACAALQSIADDNDINVNLGCRTAAELPTDGNGGGEPALEEYLRAVDSILTAYADETQRLFEKNALAGLDQSLENPYTREEEAQDLDDYLVQSASALLEAALAIEALGAPDEAQEQHEAFLASVPANLERTEAIRADLARTLQQAQQEGSIFNLDTSIAFIDIHMKATQHVLIDSAAAVHVFCTEMQSLANEHNVAVDLGCEAFG